MCEPTTILTLTSLAVSAVGAVVQNSATNKAIEAQNAADNANTAEGYRVAQEQSRQAEASAFEQRTDRARQAARQLAMARVGAAEGSGSLAANAINITAAEGDDMSRIDATLANQKSTVRGQMAALQTGAKSQMAVTDAQGRVSQTQAGLSIGKALVGAGTSYFGKASDTELMKNKRTSLPN